MSAEPQAGLAPGATHEDERRIDWPQTRALVRAYFRLGTRGSMRQMYGQKNDHKARGLWISYVSMVFFGSFFGLSVFSVREPFAWFMLLHTMTFGLVMMTAILESSLVLFNPAEEDVLGHRPIGARTLIAAKTLNLTATALLLAFAFNLIPTFCIWGLPGVGWWGPLVHLFALVLSSLCCCAGVVFMYGLMARLFGHERFKTLVTWIQVAMVLFFSIGYQLIGQGMTRLQGLSLERYGHWFLPLPPAWFAGLETALGDPLQAPRLFWLMAALGSIVPIALAWAAVLRLASMQGQIAGTLLEQAAPPAEKTMSAKAATRRDRQPNPLLRLWLRDPVEREVFRLITTYLHRDRFTMQQVYPQLGFIVLYPVLMLFIGHDRHGGGPQQGVMLYFGMVFLAMLAPTCLEILRHSASPAASELFAVAPLASPGALFHGVRKTVLYGLALPAVLALVLVYWLAVPNPFDPLITGLPLIGLIPTLSLLPGITGQAYLPLSEPPRQGRAGARLMSFYMFSLLFSGTVLAVSYFARQYHFYYLLLAVELPVVALLHYALLRVIARPRPIRLD